MKVAIVGAGAIGGVLAGRLCAAGRDVLLVARGAQLEALRHKPLKLVTHEGDVHIKVPVTDRLADIKSAEMIVCAVKSFSLPTLANQIKPQLDPNATVISVVNGVPWWFFEGLPAPLGGMSLQMVDDGSVARSIPSSQALGCVVYIGASSPAYGTFSHDMGGRWIFGELSGEMSHRLQEVIAIMTVPGFTVQGTDKIRDAVFAKLQTNVSFNALSALTRSTVGQLLEDPRMCDLLLQIMEECRAIAQAVDVDKGPPPQLASFASLSAMRTSTLQDVEAGRPLEIDGILGAICEIGERLGVAVPQTLLAYSLLTCLARSNGLHPGAVAERLQPFEASQ